MPKKTFDQMEATLPGAGEEQPEYASEYPRRPKENNTSTHKGRKGRKFRGHSSSAAADALEAHSRKEC